MSGPPGDVAGNWTTLRRLEAFCAVAETGNWTKAAAHGMDAAGSDYRLAWQLVQQFSRDLFGDASPRLIERIPRGHQTDPEVTLRLTEAGRAVYGVAREALEATKRLRDIARTGPGPVRVCCYPAHVHAVVASAMARSTVPMAVQEADDAYRVDGGRPLFEMLRHRSIDLVIAPMERAHLGIESRALYEWHLVAVTKGRRSEEVDPSDLADRPLVMSPARHASRELAEALFNARGITPHVVHESRSTESLLALVDAGLATALLPSDAVWKTRGRSVSPIAGPRPSWHGLHYRRGEITTDSRLGAVVETLLEVAKEIPSASAPPEFDAGT